MPRVAPLSSLLMYMHVDPSVQIRDSLIDAEDENVGLNQDLLEEVHEDLNSLEDYLAR